MPLSTRRPVFRREASRERLLNASLVDSLVLLAPSVACSLLRRQEDGPAARDLGAIFE